MDIIYGQVNNKKIEIRVTDLLTSEKTNKNPTSNNNINLNYNLIPKIFLETKNCFELNEEKVYSEIL